MRKEADGWHIDDNWFLKYVWCGNFFGTVELFIDKIGGKIKNLFGRPHSIEPPEFSYPKNLCSLVSGSFLGVFVAIIYPCALLLVFALVCLFLVVLCIMIVRVFEGFMNVSWSFATNYVFIICSVGACLVVGFILFLFKTNPGKIFRECIKAKKAKRCPTIIIENK